MSTITYTVTIASAKFLIDGAIAPKLTFRDGDTYEFDQADSSNSGHILQFSITSNNSGGAEYTTGVTKAGTPGSAGAKTTIITSTSTTDTLYYYSSGGGTHGEEFSNSGFNTSTTYNLLKPIVGAETTAEKWGPMINHSIDQISEKFTALDAIPAFDDNRIQTNIALLGFKVAVNGSLAKYDLQDQIIDEYETEAGVNTGDSTNQTYTSGVSYSSATTPTGPTGGNSTDTSVSGYTTRVFTSDGALTVTTGGNVTVLVVAGGGSGGAFPYGGGGGAGGLVYDAVYAVTANTYDAVVGDGGVASAVGAAGHGRIGGDSTFTINSGAMQFTAKGGGGGNVQTVRADDGGSGGGSGYASGAAEYGATTQAGTTQGVTPDVSIGYHGGELTGHPNYNPGGGGGAGGIGGTGSSAGGTGGLGVNYSSIFGTAVGESGWFASGGGGGYGNTGGSGATSNGGGGAGGPVAGNGEAGQANTGGGSGGGGNSASLVGGSGVILVRYANADFPPTYNDLILQSSDTTAEAAPTKADMVMLVEDAGSGVGTVNTHIKGWVSMYETGGTKTWTQGTLVDEGHWEGGPSGGKRILAFHDLTLTGTSGTQMAYKITTHSESAVYKTKIHATSIGWR